MQIYTCNGGGGQHFALGGSLLKVFAKCLWTATNQAASYVYDADGAQLIRHNPGRTTIDLGADELTYDTASRALTGTRYYPIPGGLTMVRIGTGALTVQPADHHGTGVLTLDADSNVSRRASDPFGNPRGPQPAPGVRGGDKGFVGGTLDGSTGLTNLGARQYEPSTGRFVAPDPVLAPDNPQQWNAYAYSNNDPVDLAAPSGLFCDGCSAHNPGSVWNHDPTADADTKQCPPFCSADGLPHGPSTGQGGNFDSEGAPGGGDLGVVYDLGDGVAPLPPKNLVQLYRRDYPTVERMQHTGTFNPLPSYELKVELYFRDQCALDITLKGCVELRDFYGLWAQIDSIDPPNRCPVCENAGLDIVLTMETGRGSRGLGKGANVGKPGGKPGCKCFLAGTQVLMADGSHRSIEDIRPGDEVTATDPETGQTGPRTVTRLIVTASDSDSDSDKEFVTPTVDTPEGPRNLTATAEHPFWSVSGHEWLPAEDLRPGTTLRSSAVRS
ncbi:RHS repeat-associated core domain-containing protein [Streptomyces sp. TLI_105]|uniref:RHS repeat-associated core domain-containing protein n=1 Tax=Streptomyces sp. TLI_105 TaxID=1881019 RepID=UPI00089BAC3C|nr:RHS repeat-associated core domain-containing protein [Streptomyces sp. TLI_105]SEE19035.1 intein N-terminal splicing region/RHS repeat-associated core domain-containing protein [Streptomyces sp. TLI_105]